MNKKTFVPVILLLSIVFSGCASEIEYWAKRMEESKQKSAEEAAKKEAKETQAQVSKQTVATPSTPVTPVSSPVTWPTPEQTSTTQQPTTPVQKLAPVTPAISGPEVTTEATFTINIKGGEKYIGEILLDGIPFKSTHGIVKIKPENITSFVDGNIRMKDGTSIKGVIDQDTLKIKTNLLGELKINTSDIESITR